MCYYLWRENLAKGKLESYNLALFSHIAERETIILGALNN